MQKETMEWTNIWWDHADNCEAGRILFIGDSITNGYRPKLREAYGGDKMIDMLATSNAVDDPAYEKQIVFMLEQYHYRAVHFNNGLHGFHLDAAAYKQKMRQIAQLLLKSVPGVVLVLSTPICAKDDPSSFDPSLNTVVQERNKAVLELSQELALPVDDLYEAACEIPHLRAADQYHYTPEGYVYLADQIKRRLGVLSIL